MVKNMKSKNPKTELEQRLDEIREVPLKMECRLLEITKNEDKLTRYKEGLLKQFESVVNDYQLSALSFIGRLLLLNSLTEGIIKIIIFDQDPIAYLNTPRDKRTLGNVKAKLIELTRQKETNENKIKTLEISLDLIKKMRNNFVHFPLYSETDYRFERMYFQVVAYLITLFNFWNFLKCSKFIEQKATQENLGTKLYDIDLYENQN
jgi:hypothetical protein